MARTKCKTTQKRKYKQNKKVDLFTIILVCDFPGYRMKSYGPTSLISIEEQKLIDYQIKTIKEAFKKYEIILCVGFDSEKICKYVRSKYSRLNLRIVENQLYNNSNSCESVRLALNNTMNDKIIICDGNLMLNTSIFSRHSLTESFVMLENNPCENLEIGVNTNEHNEVQHFSYGASRIWSEIIFLNGKDIIESLRRTISIVEYKNKFIFEALNELIKNKYKIYAYDNDDPIKKINNIKTYHSIKR